VYFIRCIPHDWSDEDAIQILQQIRSACAPESTLIFVEHLMSFACSTPPSIEGASLLDKPEPPKPLLNSISGKISYSLDVTLMGILNGQERTITQWQSWLRKLGSISIIYLAKKAVSITSCARQCRGRYCWQVRTRSRADEIFPVSGLRRIVQIYMNHHVP